MIKKSRAIVLHKAFFGESSYLVKLMTDSSGIITVKAQGARNIKSRFFSHFEIGTCLEIYFLDKVTSNLYTITDSTILYCFDTSKCSYPQLLSIQSVSEIYSQIIFPDEDSLFFFNLLLTFLEYIPSVQSNHLLIIWRFLLKLIDVLGFPITDTNDGTFTMNPCEKKSIANWLKILPFAGNFINKPNILNESCTTFNKYIIDWLSAQLHYQIKCKALKMYEVHICSLLK